MFKLISIDGILELENDNWNFSEGQADTIKVCDIFKG